MAETSPFEDGVPISDYSQSVIFRCQRCKAYVNPNFNFIDNGQAAICNLCKMTNKVPPEYYSPFNEYRLRADKY